MEKMYHVGFDNTHGAKYAILPGDPGRVEKIASYLESPVFLAQNREYTSYVGTLEGVTTFVRIGTCGGMATSVIGGDLVVANAAIRMEGTSKEYVPVEFPAVSNIDVTNALIAAGKALGLPTHCGVVQCKDSFYGQHSPERMPMGDELMSKWKSWITAGCLASEMESSALFVVSSVLGARAGCILNVCWNQERKRMGLSNPECHDTTMAVRAAVEAVRTLIKQDKADKK
ncbi:MAG: nucleoside phosphorylase [Angelakisella sp.]